MINLLPDFGYVLLETEQDYHELFKGGLYRLRNPLDMYYPCVLEYYELYECSSIVIGIYTKLEIAEMLQKIIRKLENE